jgi:DNA-binding GntR family transcriptional regulator
MKKAKLPRVSEPAAKSAPAARPLRMNASAIADEVGRMIESRALRAGEHIREQDLADRFGVSRGPVREALKILSSRFQVEIRPNLGATVPQLQPQEILEIHELRGAILSICAKWTARRASDAELEAIVTVARSLKKLADKGDIDEFLAAAYNWRRLVVEAAHSRRLAHSFASHGFGSVAQITNSSSGVNVHMAQVARDWLKCSLALEERDGDAAARAIAEEYARDQQQLERSFAGMMQAF